MAATLQLFTAAQIATALGMKRQAAQWHLRDIAPAGVCVVAGNEAAGFSLAQLPAVLRERLASEAEQQRCRTPEALLTMPRKQWQPAIPLAKLAADCITAATQLREALRPALLRQHDGAAADDFEAAGLAEYKRVFGNDVSRRYWRELFMRTIRRDAGAEDWNRLELYLPDRLAEAAPAAAVVSEALAEDFTELDTLINLCVNPHDPSSYERAGIWAAAMKKFAPLVRGGQSEKSAGRRMRQFLTLRAPFLAASQDALLKMFNRKLAACQAAGGDLLAVRDGRSGNGRRVEIAAEDIDRLRHSAAFLNGGRIDAAWREEYKHLSEATRNHYPYSIKAPSKIHELVNREMVDALRDRHQGKRKLKRRIGGVTRDSANIPAMHSWSVDDWTSNVEVYLTNADGTYSLIQPQIITVMDRGSRKWVSWAISPDKAPNARLVCRAILNGFKKCGIPSELWLENGFVFGKSTNVNGKVDEEGRTIVAGLQQYGCTINHFQKMNPQSKGELEKSFDLFQRKMERLPGYGGRLQMVDAPEDFKREQQLIRTGKAPAARFRYSLAEFIVLMDTMIAEFNATPRGGHLQGVSPDEAFQAKLDPKNPPAKCTPEVEWIFAFEKTRVLVKAGGVRFSMYGKPIQVRGGELLRHIGKELWAMVDREDASLVTFITLDYTDTFTIEACRHPSLSEATEAPEISVLADEQVKVKQHVKYFDLEHHRLQTEYGNPRRDLLSAVRNQPTSETTETSSPGRRILIDPRVADSGQQMHEQRAEIKQRQAVKNRTRSQARRFEESAGVVLDETAREAFDPEMAAKLAKVLKGNNE